MIVINDLSLQFSDKKLFEDVNLKFVPQNCYGIIGANGAGKSTFLKILSGDQTPTTGEVLISKNLRISVLKQDHFQFDNFNVLETVIMGNIKLYNIMKERENIYKKEVMTDEDGIKASELEFEFAELGGWESESDAGIILNGLGIETELHTKFVKDVTSIQKVKILLAQAIFGKPDILILDEPTNHLDVDAIRWFEEFISNFEGTVIVVSHDRHFLNNVCTYICDVDYKKIKLYIGNYDFWYESNQLNQKLLKDQNKKKEEKVKELQEFIARFSANASKSKQATSRKKWLEKIKIEDIQPSNRKYPYIHFKMEKELGKDVLTIDGLTKSIDDDKILDNISFIVNKGDKIAFVGNEIAISTFFEIISGLDTEYNGDFKWGVTAKYSYFSKDNNKLFENDYNLIDILREYSFDKSDTFIRGFLGRMLFSGEESNKKARILSGGEKVRVTMAKMMLENPNVLILDQPTNHLDLEAITALNKSMIDFQSNILFASHDYELLQSVATRIIYFNDDGTIFDKSISYEEFIEYQKLNNFNK